MILLRKIFNTLKDFRDILTGNAQIVYFKDETCPYIIHKGTVTRNHLLKYGKLSKAVLTCPELKADLDSLDEETRNYIVGNNN